jgi:tyrosine decarboxylase / aspartate 1-decarboxylase
MKLEKRSITILTELVEQMEKGFASLPDTDNSYNEDAVKKVLLETAERMQDNYPYFHPLYAGQMLKPPHPVARMAYMMSMWINPNNHALDGSKASSPMEKEAVAEIAKMFGWSQHLGHLCGGGTMANLEALWISGKTRPGKAIVASEMAHYTQSRISDVLQLEFQPVPSDINGRMDTDALEEILRSGNVGTVVATIGTTGAGAIDPLPQILDLQKKYGFRIHADAAYGGYFKLVDNLGTQAKQVFDCIEQVDSIVIDPHKHGLQPYGCGCILFKDPSVGAFYKHDSPYTYFTSKELHLGEISLECSRPGASAVALWATQKLLPMIPCGEFANGLTRCRQAALKLYEKIAADSRFKTIMKPELDIVVWAPAGDKASQISALSQNIFDLAAENNLHLATFSYPARLLKQTWKDLEFDEEQVICLRSCLMKPEHLDWLDRIWEILDKTVKGINKK